MGNVLQRRPGQLVNRVPTPPEWSGLGGGDFVWCLGSIQPGWTARFASGADAYVEQSAAYGAARYYNPVLGLRGPSAMPEGWRWEAYVARGADEVWARAVPVGQALEVFDVLVPTTSQAQPMLLRFGLRLVGPGGGEERELEIPAFLVADVDAVEAETLPQLGNALPSPGEANVESGSDIAFDVVDPLGLGPSTTLVTVDGQLVYDGAQVLAGWGFQAATPRDGSRRYTLAPPERFASGARVEVLVDSTTTDGRAMGARGYHFTVVDTSAPTLEFAQGRAPGVVRARFSEAVDDSALEHAAYQVARLTTPAVELLVVGVRRVSPREVDLQLDIPASPRASYQLNVVGVRDTSGNFIAAPDNTTFFTGYARPAPPGRRFSLWHMLPQMNREEDDTGDLERFIGVLQEPVDLLLADVDAWTDILDVDVAEERYLDQMLLGLGNPFVFELNVEDKRRLIRVLVPMMRQKGTAVGITNTVRFFLGLEVEVQPLNAPSLVWNLGDDELGVGTLLTSSEARTHYSFEVVAQVVLTDVQRERIRAIVDFLKPAHTHFVQLVEPSSAPAINHAELGLSELGTQFLLH